MTVVYEGGEKTVEVKLDRDLIEDARDYRETDRGEVSTTEYDSGVTTSYGEICAKIVEAILAQVPAVPRPKTYSVRIEARRTGNRVEATRINAAPSKSVSEMPLFSHGPMFEPEIAYVALVSAVDKEAAIAEAHMLVADHIERKRAAAPRAVTFRSEAEAIAKFGPKLGAEVWQASESTVRWKP